jgi:hypothetical protein
VTDGDDDAFILKVMIGMTLSRPVDIQLLYVLNSKVGPVGLVASLPRYIRLDSFLCCCYYCYSIQSHHQTILNV